MKNMLKTPDRRLVVVGAIMIQLALGAIYAWSVFTARLTDAAGVYAFSASQTAWVFSSSLATFAIVMVLAGRILPATGPRALSIAGGLLLGLGYIIGGFFGQSFWVQLFSVGIVSGTGIGRNETRRSPMLMKSQAKVISAMDVFSWAHRILSWPTRS